MAVRSRTPRNSGTAFSSAAASRNVRIGELANAGTKTPEACLETLIWATSHSEVDALADTLVLSPASEMAVDAVVDRLPSAERGNYRPPERLVALLWTREWMAEGELSACRVVDVTQRDGVVSFGLDWVFDSGRIRRSRITFVRLPSGWRQLVPSTFVDGLMTENLLPPTPPSDPPHS